MVTERQRRRVSDDTLLRGIFTIERLVCIDLNRARHGRHIYIAPRIAEVVQSLE
jgi:predicted RNA-binding protein YlxR (DUF448 family)